MGYAIGTYVEAIMACMGNTHLTNTLRYVQRVIVSRDQATMNTCKHKAQHPTPSVLAGLMSIDYSDCSAC